MAGRPVVGQVVRSISGRDCGRTFVVVNIIDDKFVEVSDGDMRPMERPKKKNVRHIELLEPVLVCIRDKLAAGLRPTNEEVRHELSRLAESSATVEEEGFRSSMRRLG